jgi:O-antigen/teichoic acid export membrane protein
MSYLNSKITAQHTKLHIYFRGSSSGLVAKAISIVSGMAIIWILNKILPKDQYGAYTFAMTIISIIAVISTAGQDRAILYRLSGDRSDLEETDCTALVINLIRKLFFLSTAVVLVIVAFSSLSTDRLGEYSFWIAALSLFIPLFVVNQLFIAWFQSQQKIIEFNLVPKIEDLSRVGLLLLSYLFFPNRIGVVVSIILSNLFLVLAFFYKSPLRSSSSKTKLPIKYVQYGIKLMFAKLVHIGLERADLILLGLITSKTMIADYFVGARLAIFVVIGNDLLTPVFTPRMRYYLRNNERALLLREYRQNRLLALLVAMGASVGFMFFGEFLLNLFGDYSGSIGILLIIAAGGIIKIGFGPTGRYLNMAGYASISLMLIIALFVVNIVLCLLLIPVLFGMGAALSTFISYFVYNAAISIYIWKKDSFPTIDFFVFFIMLGASLSIIFAAFGFFDTIVAGFFILLLIAGLLASNLELLLPSKVSAKTIR